MPLRHVVMDPTNRQALVDAVVAVILAVTRPVDMDLPEEGDDGVDTTIQ